MIEIYEKSETEDTRGDEGSEELRVNPDGSEDAGRVGSGIGSLGLSPDRKGSPSGTTLSLAIGGILDQLLEDAQKQLVKSNECIVWYQSEAREYEEKIQNLLKLKSLRERELESENGNPTSD